MVRRKKSNYAEVKMLFLRHIQKIHNHQQGLANVHSVNPLCELTTI